MSYAARSHRYAADVLEGRIPAGKWIRLACKRYQRDLKSKSWTFDVEQVERVCSFAEKMRHEKGALQGQSFRLQPFQIWLLASIFGFLAPDGRRKYREVLIMLPRGSGKSPLAAVIALWMAFMDGELGSEVLTAATTEKQAREVFSPAQYFVREVPGFKKLEVEAAAKSIFQTSTRSKFFPVIGKAKYGASPYLAILDEAHQLTDTQQLDNFRTGLAKRKNSMLLVISTAGVSSLENPCLMMQKQAEEVLDGLVEKDWLFAAIWAADLDLDWTSIEALKQASPNLGVSIDFDTLRQQQLEAARSPAQQNAFRAMALNQWMSVASAWITVQAWDKCKDESLTVENVKHLPCVIGSDLASKLDLAACVRVFRDDSQGNRPHYYALTRCYLPEDRTSDPTNSHYKAWVSKGFLTATPGSSIDYSTIEADILADIAECAVDELPYDARYADQWSQRVSETSGIARVEVPPSPAVLSPAMKELEAAIYDGRFHHDGHPVLRWCMANVLTRETAAGNYTMPTKQRREAKIDAAMALFIGMVRAMLTRSQNDAWSFTPFSI